MTPLDRLLPAAAGLLGAAAALAVLIAAERWFWS